MGQYLRAKVKMEVIQITPGLPSGVQNKQGEHHVIHSIDAFDFFSPRLTKCSQPRSPTYFAGFYLLLFKKKS